MNVNVDVSLLLGRLVLGLLDRLQSGQVTQDLGKTVVGNVEFFLPVLQLLLLTHDPVDAVPDADATAVLDIARNAFSQWCHVLKGAAHVAHATVDPFGLFRIGLEDVVDFAHRKKTSNLLQVGSHAADDAHIDGIRRANVTDAFSFGEKFGEFVGTSQSGTGGADGH
ncbi:hypothetical protein Ptr902_05788 [Pyrenophora tritici-repentis]|uniref:Uncharacterized protein n=1 Tax=Pyrenophora tritici-repentis TaxID=45151 RepID=A0A834S4H3_9PLEO|nr:hypothetical protein PtrM4_070720 [Pyrenophora tritici-repentis]KAI2483471.1 hypothetical protein Ptr902_05788 [Pyrenophora tritici-repentis]